MPLTISDDSLFTITELEAYFAEHGDRAPKRTIKKLKAAGLVPRGGKLVTGSDLIAALDRLGEQRGPTK